MMLRRRPVAQAALAGRYWARRKSGAVVTQESHRLRNGSVAFS